MDKISAINALRKSKMIKKHRSFLGLINYCMKFIPGLAVIEIPLNTLLKEETKRSVDTIEWNAELENAFKNAKQCISEKTPRQQPDFKK